MSKVNPLIPTVALAMIVKNTPEELSYLDACLASVSEHVDAIYIDFNGSSVASNSTIAAVVNKYNIKAEYRVWEKNFVKARKDVFKRVASKYQWILWLDADDTVENPEKIKQIAAITSSHVDGLLATYDYSHDDYGNVTTSHMSMRLVRNNGSFSWKSSFDDGGESVHESLVQTHAVNKLGTEDFKIIHHSNGERQTESLFRNIELLEKMYERLLEKKQPDPRILYYLGVHYYDAGRYVEARERLAQYIKLSGWSEERSEAWVYVGLIYRFFEHRPDNAENSFLQAIKENSANPDPYVELADICMSQDRNEAAELWLNRALQSPKPKTTMILHPQEATYRVFKSLATLYTRMDGSKLTDAQNYIKKALELRPYDLECQKLRELIDRLIEVRDQTRAIATVGRLFKKGGNERVREFLDMLPLELQDNTLVMQIRQDVMDPVKWAKKSIAIYLGESTLGTWGPDNLETGIGGSEESVIQLSRLLGQLGWHVTIYGTPGEQAGHDRWRAFGSLDEPAYNGGKPGHYAPYWKHYWEFNPNDKFDVLISWRNPMMFDYEIKARKKYLWIHDVIEAEEFTKFRLKNLTKVMFVSQYHADIYKDVIPEDKIFVTGNGIDPKAFAEQDDLYTRQDQRMVYMSAHERGLEVLYDVWPIVKRAVPLAKLDVYYGWQSFDAITKNNPPQQQWKSEMIAKEKKLIGVTNHGRIGHKQIIKEIFKADVFAYPCTFPEVYCITLIKAMAGGAYPVTSDFSVVKDFNTYGPQVHYDKTKYEAFKKAYAKQLIESLKADWPESSRSEMMREVRKKFSWTNTAEGWNNEMS